MYLFNLHRFNFRHLILGVSAVGILVLTLLVAFISSQVAFNEMNKNLYQQAEQAIHNLADDSIAPLLYDSVASAEVMLDTLVNMPQITAVNVMKASNKSLVKHQDAEHVIHNYPQVSKAEPFKIIETADGWYLTELVLSRFESNDLSNDFSDGSENNDDAVIVLGYVNVGVSKSNIYASRRNIFIRNFSVSATVGTLLLFFMYQILRSLTRPLEELSALMEQGQRGEYPDNVIIKGTQEITDISKTFNDMIAAIKEREQNLSLTLDSIGDAVIATDAKGCIVRMNPVAQKLTGWELAAAVGKSVKDIFPIINATTREVIKNPVEKVLDSGETVYLSNHTTLISKDKTEYQIADSAAPIRNKEGEILGMVLVFNDVTEQYRLRQDAAKSKRDLQAIMDNSPAVIYIKNIEGRFTFVNLQFENLFKISSKKVLGKYLHDIFPEDIADQMQGNDRAVIDAAYAIESEEMAPHEDGVHTYMSMKFPLFDEENNVYAVCGISTDITERRKQEEQLKRSQKMDALGKLTGGVAHDYNNMLGVVMGYAEILKDELAGNPVLEKYAGQIHHAAERGAKLTQKLLNFSRKKMTNSETVDINELLQHEQDMLEKIITARIKLVLNLQNNLWPIWIDSSDLEDAIVNLCINAMHAMESNGQLTIQTRHEQLTQHDADVLHLKPGDYVVLCITDTGCGMSIDTQQYIFEPFFTTKGGKGTGLGLAQVYGFVERSGGTICVYSELGEGSQFMLYFPRYIGTDENIISSVSNTVEEENTALGLATILVVDDEPALLELTCRVLEKNGYNVYAAKNGIHALEILKHESIDLLLSDVIMPEMDGYQLANIVKETYPLIKIQLASGFADDRNSHMVDDELQQNMLTKPYSSKVLLTRISEVLA